MRPDTVARRYARALFNLAEEQGALDAVATALEAASRVVEDPAVARVLAGPVDRTRKRALVETIARDVAAPPLLERFLFLLVDSERIGHLAAIRSVFDDLVDRRRGIVRARVRAAAPLPDDVRDQIAQVFGRVTGKQVVLSVEVVPTLLAGVVVEVDGRVYDGSLHTQLEKLREQMAES